MAAASAGMGGADLVIGVGNPLRGDDGLSWHLVRDLRRRRRSQGLRLVPQLVPELALEVAAARRLLVVDAWCAPGLEAPPRLRRLGPAAGDPGMASGHRLDPGGLLALATLFREDPPPAWLLLLPAYAFPHDTALSRAARRHLPLARQLLRRWLAAPSPWGRRLDRADSCPLALAGPLPHLCPHPDPAPAAVAGAGPP